MAISTICQEGVINIYSKVIFEISGIILLKANLIGRFILSMDSYLRFRSEELNVGCWAG